MTQRAARCSGIHPPRASHACSGDYLAYWDLARISYVRDSFDHLDHLGYPVYSATMLGVAKTAAIIGTWPAPGPGRSLEDMTSSGTRRGLPARVAEVRRRAGDGGSIGIRRRSVGP